MDDEFEQIQEKRSRMFSRLKPKILIDFYLNSFSFQVYQKVISIKGDIMFDFLPEQKTKGAAVFHAVLGADSFFCLLAVVL